MIENIEGTIKKGQSRETGNIGYTRWRKTKQKHNTICVRHHYPPTVRNNVNKTCSLLQKTGGKDEPNIVYMWKSKRKSQHGTQNVNTHNRTTQKTKKMSNTDSTNKPGVNSCAREGYAVPTSYKTPVMVLTYSIQGGHVTVASF